MTLISVILPYRDAEATIGRAIASILSQSFKELELILIDDHSSDGSRIIAESTGDNRIRVIDNPGKGIVAALNFGIAQASGTYIARMDADDLSLPGRLESQWRHLAALPDNFVSSCKVRYCNRFTRPINTTGYQLHVDWLNSIETASEHFFNRFIDAPIAHPTLFCRKELFTLYGSYIDERRPEDFELWLRWMHQGVQFEKVDEVLYDWYDHADRLSRQHANYATDKFDRIRAQYFASWWKTHDKLELWVIGYGKEVFRRTNHLTDHKLTISGYVDIIPRPKATKQVIGYADIDPSANRFYLVYVSDRKGKKLISEFFDNRSMKVSEDYIFMV